MPTSRSSVMLPKAGEFTVAIDQSDDRLVIRHVDADSKCYFSYTVYADKHKQDAILNSFKTGRPEESVPITYYDSLFLNKIRTGLGIKFNLFNFFSGFFPGGGNATA